MQNHWSIGLKSNCLYTWDGSYPSIRGKSCLHKIIFYITDNFTIQNILKQSFNFMILRFNLISNQSCRFEIVWRNENSRYYARIHDSARSRYGSQSTPEFPRLSTDRRISSVVMCATPKETAPKDSAIPLVVRPAR